MTVRCWVVAPRATSPTRRRVLEDAVEFGAARGDDRGTGVEEGISAQVVSVLLAVQPVERPRQLFGKADDQRQRGLRKPLGQRGCKEFGVRVSFRGPAVLDEVDAVRHRSDPVHARAILDTSGDDPNRRVARRALEAWGHDAPDSEPFLEESWDWGPHGDGRSYLEPPF